MLLHAPVLVIVEQLGMRDMFYTYDDDDVKFHATIFFTIVWNCIRVGWQFTVKA